ncbi:hypothetical protein ACN47E_005698 [Coniothyrium glycines]
MSSPPGAQGAPKSRVGPPYPPPNAGLGGMPSILPDIPISAIFLVAYLVLGVIHIKISKANKGRGHKFIFNGAILGLCKIRIITMSLRMAWAFYPRNTGLTIAANIFVYAGTIILYLVDWFFVQRVIRAQHTHFGWSTGYRIFHRAGLALLIITLLMLIISQVWQNFTLHSNKLSVFHDLSLVAHTYFTIFTIAPAVMVIISLLIPRTEVEKFGAGRLRNNIKILLVSVFLLSIGQIFRCVLAWIPPTPLRSVQRGNQLLPWYLTKACFYCFNFVTEVLVIIMFAVVRVDLRFHVPNGSRKSGDYSSSRVHLDKLDSEKSLPTSGLVIYQNNSSEILHQYQSSVFEETSTLADSLRYPSSIMEVDEKTGTWKVKRISRDSSSRTSISFSTASRSSTHHRDGLVAADAPPVPNLPAEWPLPDSMPPRSSEPVLVHPNPVSQRETPQRQGTYEIKDHELNNTNVGDAVTDALAKLEMNSETNKSMIPTSLPRAYKPVSPGKIYKPSQPFQDDSRSYSSTAHKRSIPIVIAVDGSRTRANSLNTPAVSTLVAAEPSKLHASVGMAYPGSGCRSSPNRNYLFPQQHEPSRITDPKHIFAERKD